MAGKPTYKELEQRVKELEETMSSESQRYEILKLRALGTLVGGIAHELNNILAIIMGNVELAIADVPKKNPAVEYLQEVWFASLRAKNVIKKILSFARKKPALKKKVHLSSVVNKSLEFLSGSIPGAIEMRLNVHCKKDVIMADPTDLDQVIINLCHNSLHAMGEGAGVLSVDLETVWLDQSCVEQFADLGAGEYAKLTVKDTGKGIAPDIKERIFDPYFTTKPVDEGLGMGLAVVQGIVRQHGGELNIESQVGKGTTVEVFLPLIDPQPQA